MTYLLAYLLTSICAGVLWFCLARFTDEEHEMMTTTYLRRPLHLRFVWWCESIYLRWRIRCAEADKRNHVNDLRHLRDDIERLSIQIEWDERYIVSVTQRLGRVLSK